MFAILLAAPVTFATLPASPRPIGARCRNPGTIVVGKAADKATIRKLGDEPAAQHIRAVYRTDFDGCVAPMVISARVGQR